MTKVRDLLAQKGTTVFTVSDSLSVLEATQRMNEHKIGALMVLRGADDSDGGVPRVVGMFTERDVW
jgi:CBS domain-containing protein